MRRWWLIPTSLILVVAAGVAGLTAAGKPLAGRELLLATVIAVLASAAALLPVRLAAAGDLAGLTQAGLVGTVSHLLLTLVLAGVAVLLGLVGSRSGLAGWLLATYMASLVAVVMVLAGVVNEAAGPGTPGRDGDAAK